MSHHQMIKRLNKTYNLKFLKEMIKMIKMYFLKIQFMIFMIGNIRTIIKQFHNHIMIYQITIRLLLFFKIKELNVSNIIHH